MTFHRPGGALNGGTEPALVLVVDDDARMRRFVGETLEMAGHRVIFADDGEQVGRTNQQHRPDLVVLDVVMPRMSGVAALRQLRASGEDVPVIMLTARDEDEDKVEALQAGADDYLVKPFSARELVARVQAVLRRARGPLGEEERLTTSASGALTLQPSSRSVRVEGREVALTRTEYTLLATLVRRPNTIFTPGDLLTKVWGAEYRDQGEILRTNMYRLRKKIEADPSSPRYLRTRSGVGYYFEP